MGSRRSLTREETAAWESFRRMSTQVDAELAQRVQRTGVSPADHAVLCALGAAPGGALRSRELRCALRWEKSRLAHQVRRMEERGLVRRSDCDDDARAAVVHLTEAGRTAVAVAGPGFRQHLRETFLDALDADQLAALTAISDTVLAHLDAVRRAGERAPSSTDDGPVSPTRARAR